jgi:hypothetical protein
MQTEMNNFKSYRTWIPADSNTVSNAKSILRDERVYEIDKIPPGAYRPLVVAITSKTSAQRLMAQLAEERGLTQDQGRYRMFAFTHPTLPGLERSR